MESAATQEEDPMTDPEVKALDETRLAMRRKARSRTRRTPGMGPGRRTAEIPIEQGRR